MGTLRRTTVQWPGFSGLWLHGSVSGLAIAVFFALLVNLASLCSFIWTEFASPGVQVLLWSMTGLCFAAATTYSFISSRGQASLREDARDLFLRAQSEYLSGKWTETEALLTQIVRRQPHDVEAILFLATVHRHTGQFDRARQQLKRLSKIARSTDWSMEIAQEWRLLRRDDAVGELSERQAPSDRAA
ncbi:MAG: tetratricopeptide repeat protein [Planctomycetales bacterium]|nr:tetratricopeptide repeat protein [Planctomycetales bacterium]